MNKEEKKITLQIEDVTVLEAKEIMKTVRSIERRDSERIVFCLVLGMEEQSAEEAKSILAEIFPVKGSAK